MQTVRGHASSLRRERLLRLALLAVIAVTTGDFMLEHLLSGWLLPQFDLVGTQLEAPLALLELVALVALVTLELRGRPLRREVSHDLNALAIRLAVDAELEKSRAERRARIAQALDTNSLPAMVSNRSSTSARARQSGMRRCRASRSAHRRCGSTRRPRWACSHSWSSKRSSWR
jgi:hypothetical protein